VRKEALLDHRRPRLHAAAFAVMENLQDMHRANFNCRLQLPLRAWALT
jgi:hypothetical protein